MKPFISSSFCLLRLSASNLFVASFIFSCMLALFVEQSVAATVVNSRQHREHKGREEAKQFRRNFSIQQLLGNENVLLGQKSQPVQDSNPEVQDPGSLNPGVDEPNVEDDSTVDTLPRPDNLDPGVQDSNPEVQDPGSLNPGVDEPNVEDNSTVEVIPPQGTGNEVSPTSNCLLGTWKYQRVGSNEVIRYIFSESSYYVVQNSPFGKIASLNQYEIQSLGFESSIQLIKIDFDSSSSGIAAFQCGENDDQRNLLIDFSHSKSELPQELPDSSFQLLNESDVIELPEGIELW